MYIAKLKAERFMMDDIEETIVFDTLHDAFETYKDRYDWLGWKPGLCTGLALWEVSGVYEYQIIDSTDGVEIHTDDSICKVSPDQLYPGEIMRVEFTISELTESEKEDIMKLKNGDNIDFKIDFIGDFKDCDEIEVRVNGLQESIDDNCDKQSKELEKYTNIIFQLLNNNQVTVTPKFGDPIYKRLSFHFNRRLDAINFECSIVENGQDDEDVKDTISRLYVLGNCKGSRDFIDWSGAKELDKFIEFLTNVAIPAFKRDPYKSISQKWE